MINYILKFFKLPSLNSTPDAGRVLGQSAGHVPSDIISNSLWLVAESANQLVLSVSWRHGNSPVIGRRTDPPIADYVTQQLAVIRYCSDAIVNGSPASGPWCCCYCCCCCCCCCRWWWWWCGFYGWSWKYIVSLGRTLIMAAPRGT